MRTANHSQTGSKNAAHASNAIELLHQDHEEVQQLFHEFEDIHEQASPEEKLELVERACQALKIHTEIEEKVFYPAVRKALEDKLMLDEAEVEHKSAKDLIKQLERMDADDDKFDAVFTVLGEYIEHHVLEEEKEMFPQVKKTDLDLDELGQRMLEMKEKLMQDADAAGGSGRKRSSPDARKGKQH